MPARAPAALGLRAHSGWAALVAVGGPSTSPHVLERRRVEMADDPEARQPYHAAEGLPPRQAATMLERFSRKARARALEGLASALEAVRQAGHDPVRVVVLTAAGRPLPELAAVLASHALIHTADGEHFRHALAQACAQHRLPVTRIREKDVLA